LFLPPQLLIPIFFVSLTIIIVCIIAWSELEDDHGSVGFGPPRQNKMKGLVFFAEITGVAVNGSWYGPLTPVWDSEAREVVRAT
jgi:hypothetical protein